MNVDKRKLWTAASVLILSGPLTAQQQPNIILFLVDDMGWPGYFGSFLDGDNGTKPDLSYAQYGATFSNGG